MKFTSWFTISRKPLVLVGTVISLIAAVLTGSDLTPVSEIMWPRNFISLCDRTTDCTTLDIYFSFSLYQYRPLYLPSLVLY